MTERRAGAVARRPHKITPNKKNEYPIRYIFFDTETKLTPQPDGSIFHTLKLGWANFMEDSPESRHTCDEWLFFHTSGEFWDFLESIAVAKKRTLVFAHNADFDMQVVNFSEELDKRNFSIQKQLIDSNRFILQVRKNQHTFLFLDTSNYCGKIPLRMLAKSLGMEKIECDPLTAPDEELIPYCHRDVEVVREYILRLFRYAKAEDLGNFAMTAASMAFNAYRHRFMSFGIFIHNNLASLDMEREAYRGGRCECFHIGKLTDKTYYYVDVNSMYPYVMSKFPYPRRLIKHYPKTNLGLLKWALRKFAVIARLKVEISEPALGIYRDKLIFPVGQFWGSFTSPEIEYILREGKILEFGAMSIYQADFIFSSFVNYFYSKRLEYRKQGDKLSDTFAKLCMNSLYGKFGQRSRKTSPAIWSPPGVGRYYQFINLTTKERSLFVNIGGRWFEESQMEEGFNAFVPIPAFVTAYARMYLWQLMKQAGRENVFYCDTDSLFVNQAGKDRLDNLISEDKDLGYLGIKAQGKTLEIHGAKMYEFDGKVRIKGVSHPDAFRAAYQQTRFLRIRSALKDDISGGVKQINLVKNLKYIYDKGNVSASGVVSPLMLSES